MYITICVIYDRYKIKHDLFKMVQFWTLNDQILRTLMKRTGPAEVSTGMIGLAPKWVRLDPKLDKSGAFSDQISVHLAPRAKCTEI